VDLGLIGLGGIALAGAAFAARRLRRPPALARAALHEVAQAVVDVAAFVLVAIVVAVIEFDELRREAANALARPKDHA
jgi:citrate lyase alpha subunit